MEISFEAVAKSAITGAWYNTFTIPFLGNFLGQSKAHAKHNIPASLVSLVVIGERVFMLFTGAMLFGFLLTLTHTNLNIINDYQKTFLVLLETIGFIGLCAILTRPWRFLPSNPFETFKIRWFLGALGITLAQWGAISMIFATFPILLLQIPLTPTLIFWTFCIGFIASLPINISGFGLREVASIYFLGLLGVSTQKALVFSITIGAISILCLACLYYTKNTWSPFFKKARKMRYSQVRSAFTQDKSLLCHDYLLVGMTLVISLLLPFHFHYVQDSYAINLNFADPFALAGCVMLIFDRKMFADTFASFPSKWFLSILSALLLSFVTALIYAEISSYAIINKVMGVFVLIGYAYMGFSALARGKPQLLEQILAIQIKTLALVTLWKALIYIGFYSELISDLLIEKHNFEGFSHDRNAFGLIIVIVLFFYHLCKHTRPSFTISSWLAAALYFAVYLTSSRTAQIVACAMVAYLLATKLLSFKDFTRYSLRFLCILMTFTALFYSARNKNHLFDSFSVSHTITVFLTTYSKTGSDHERFITYQEGLRLFMSHPLFGIGLGQFRELWIKLHGHALIIHNSFLWILAEMGVVGFILIFSYPTLLSFNAFKELARNFLKKMPLPMGAVLTFGFLMIVCLYALPQEIFYQRVLWFYLGVMFALRHTLSRQA